MPQVLGRQPAASSREIPPRVQGYDTPKAVGKTPELQPVGGESGTNSIQILVHVKCDPYETKQPEGNIDLVSSVGPDTLGCAPDLHGIGKKETTWNVTAEQLRANIEASGTELTPSKQVAGTDATVWFQLIALDSKGTVLGSSEKKILQEAGTRMQLTGAHPVEWAVELHGIDEQLLRKCYDTDGYRLRCKVGHENDGEDNMTSAWQLSELIVTYIQHDHSLQTGEHAVLTHVSNRNIQWHFLPNDEKHWIGHTANACPCTKYTIEAKKMQIEMLQQQIAELQDELAVLEEQNSVEQVRWTDPDMCEPRCRAHRPRNVHQLGECPHCQLEIECRKADKPTDSASHDDRQLKERLWKIGVAAVSLLILLILIIIIA